MRLTRKKATELCIELWTWCAETGKPKDEWSRWEELIGLKSASECCYCWFCYYDEQQTAEDAEPECEYCPYNQEYGYCSYSGGLYKTWSRAESIIVRKKYAKLFLEQIKSLK